MKHRGPNGMYVPASGLVPLRELRIADGPHGDDHGNEKLGDYKNRVDALPDVRDEKVDDLRDAVETGNYFVESDKLAKKVVDDAIREAAQRERPLPR